MASLPNWVQGARRPSMLVTWYREGTTVVEDLTGATLTGTIAVGLGSSRAVRAITGDLVITDADGGVFRWDLSAADVADEGDLEVQFSAAFGSGQTPAITFVTKWQVRHKQVVS